MINYEGNGKSYPSERYCKRVEQQFGEQALHCDGNCYYFGYDFNVEAVLNHQRVSWHFLRHQTTQNGIFIPKDAHEYAECAIAVNGLNQKYRFQLKRPFFRFLSNFSAANTAFRLRGTIPNHVSERIREFLINNDVKRLEVKKGVLYCTVFDEPEQPFVLAKNLQDLIPD